MTETEKIIHTKMSITPFEIGYIVSEHKRLSGLYQDFCQKHKICKLGDNIFDGVLGYLKKELEDDRK